MAKELTKQLFCTVLNPNCELIATSTIGIGVVTTAAKANIPNATY